jgi:ubiquitin-protein ligase
MARVRRITHLFDEFNQNLRGKSIADYFQIDHTKYELKRIDDQTFEFKLSYEVFPRYAVDLPIELSMKIAGYLYEYTQIYYQIRIPNDYPFKPPLWVMQTITPPELYNDAVHVLNYRYDTSWSPAITMEKDILNMIECIEFLKN